MERIALNYDRCMAEVLGSRGISPGRLEELRPSLDAARKALDARRRSGDLAWMDLPYVGTARLVEYAEAQRGRFDNLLVLGIGGSALGLTALATALLHPQHNLLPGQMRAGVPRLFVVDNVDPDEILGLLGQLDLRRTLVNVVSKSGTTAETMAAYLLVRDMMAHAAETRGPRPASQRSAVSGAAAEAERGWDYRRNLVFTTDPEQGALREIGRREGVALFDVPPGVGGRFSVLSPVGLLPAALLGIDVDGLLEGARVTDASLAAGDVLSAPACMFTALQYTAYVDFDRRISVMMPYSGALKDVADWYRQLWAESLGKAVDREGNTVNTGPTPVKALGATDQHSQVQLYAEGPDDKIITFLRVHRFATDTLIPNVHPEEDSLRYLAGHSFGELLNAEQVATSWALARQGKPSVTISLPRVDAGVVGQLLYMLEAAVALMGELFDIDAFNQPGVELGKEATYALMGREGYEDLRREIEAETEDGSCGTRA